MLFARTEVPRQAITNQLFLSQLLQEYYRVAAIWQALHCSITAYKQYLANVPSSHQAVSSSCSRATWFRSRSRSLALNWSRQATQVWSCWEEPSERDEPDAMNHSNQTCSQLQKRRMYAFVCCVMSDVCFMFFFPFVTCNT